MTGLTITNKRGGFPGDTSGKEPACHLRRSKRLGFDPWVGKIPWRRAWQPTPVFLPGESHGQGSLVGYVPQDCRVRHEWSDLAQHSKRGVHIVNAIFSLSYVTMSIYFLGFGWFPLSNLSSSPLFLIANTTFILRKGTMVGRCRAKVPLSCPWPQILLLIFAVFLNIWR